MPSFQLIIMGTGVNSAGGILVEEDRLFGSRSLHTLGGLKRTSHGQLLLITNTDTSRRLLIYTCERRPSISKITKTVLWDPQSSYLSLNSGTGSPHDISSLKCAVLML